VPLPPLRDEAIVALNTSEVKNDNRYVSAESRLGRTFRGHSKTGSLVALVSAPSLRDKQSLGFVLDPLEPRRDSRPQSAIVGRKLAGSALADVGATSVVLRSRNLGHANPSITLSAALGERQRKTAVASAGEPTTAPSSRASPFIPPRQPVATSGDPVRTPVTPEVAGSSPVAPAGTMRANDARCSRCASPRSPRGPSRSS
jgi:hypothetical protein